MAFRTTPQLGPQLDDTGPYYWDGVNITEPSYRLGNKEVGSDGHEYVHVTAAGDLAADARVNIDPATWVATADGSGTHQAIVDVAEGAAFQARKFVL